MTTTPNESYQKKWYKRVGIWITTVALTAIGSFITATIVKLLEVGAEKAGTPFSIVSEHIEDVCRGGPLNYAIPAENLNSTPLPSELHSTNLSSEEWEEIYGSWKRAVGAIDGDTSGVRITITGKSERPVILQSLDIDVEQRELPRHAFTLDDTTACSDQGVRYLSYNLDRHPPRLIGSMDARNFGRVNQGEVENPVMFPYKVSITESEVFQVRTRTAECDCRWRLRLHWVSGDESGDFIIDNKGNPFRTIATRNLPPLPQN